MRLHILALLTLLMAASMTTADTLHGTVTYRERMMLPPDAVLEIRLEDVSRADAPAQVLASQRIEAPGAPPYPFSLEFDAAAIDAARSYSLRASVHQGTRLLMTTDTAYPVLTRGGGDSAEMLLKRVGDPMPDADFLDSYWKLTELAGEAVAVVDDRREPHLILRSDGSYNATVGCNMMRGSVAVDGDSVTFGPGAMTMMACPPPLDRLERALGQALGAAAAYRIGGEQMELLDASGATLARFRVVHL